MRNGNQLFSKGLGGKMTRKDDNAASVFWRYRGGTSLGGLRMKGMSRIRKIDDKECL